MVSTDAVLTIGMNAALYDCDTDAIAHGKIRSYLKVDELVKSRETPFFVIPAKAGIQFFQLVTEFLDSGFHRSDDFLRSYLKVGIMQILQS